MFDWVPSMTEIVAGAKAYLDVLGPEMWIFIFLPVALSAIAGLIILIVRAFQGFSNKLAGMFGHHDNMTHPHQTMSYEQWQKNENKRGYWTH